MDSLDFEIVMVNAPDEFIALYDMYVIYWASTKYKGATYKAWGTDEQEAKKKAFDLITLDKVNGIVRKEGEIVE